MGFSLLAGAAWAHSAVPAVQLGLGMGTTTGWGAVACTEASKLQEITSNAAWRAGSGADPWGGVGNRAWG